MVAIRNCQASGNAEWEQKHRDEIERIVDDGAPSGSGFDSGTTIDLDASTENKLVFTTEYHHMSDAGFYDGWTSHRITVRPSFAFGYRLSISGQNRNGIKEYAAEIFGAFLDADIT